MLFSLLDDSFSPLPISPGYLYSEAQLHSCKESASEIRVSSPFCLGKIYKVGFETKNNFGEKAGEVLLHSPPLSFR
jgi:hypothetical protein